MKKALTLLFVGYIFTFIRIDVFFDFDILPDPLGFLMIAIGLNHICQRFLSAIRARNVAFILIFVSMPTIIIDIGQVSELKWITYAFILSILKLALVYYIFTLFNKMIDTNPILSKRVYKTAVTYVAINLLLIMLTSFSVNMTETLYSVLFFILLIPALVMEIIFLFLILAVRTEIPE